jgi:aspartyl-tRNA synthetase
MSFVDEEDVFGVIEQVIGRVFQEELSLALPTPFPRLTYQQAQERYHTDKPDLRAAEQPWAFCWVVEFPLFHWNPETKRWDAEHHPFTAPHPDDAALVSQEPGRVRARAYDLVLNGTELGSGSIRIHQAPMQRQIFKVLGLSEALVQERFGFLLQAFAYGAPPHGGFAVGLDRLVALIAKTESIRDVIAFPKTAKAVCPLTNAPSEVSEAQLKELHLRIVNGGDEGMGRALRR